MSKNVKIITMLVVILNLLLMALGHLIYVGMVAETFDAFTIFGIISFINVILLSLTTLKKGRFVFAMLVYEVLLCLFISFEINVLVAIIINMVFASYLIYFGYVLYKKTKQRKLSEANKE